MRRAVVSIVLVIGGLWIWFGPWHASMPGDGSGNSPATVQVACAAAPVDLYIYGGGAVASTPESSACRTSAWLRTVGGVFVLGLGIGGLSRDRTRARVAQLNLAAAA